MCEPPLERAGRLPLPPLRVQRFAPLAQKFANFGGNFGGMGFQCKVAGFVETHHRLGDIALEGVRTRWQEERIMPPPRR
jgi:hypothetical protein